MHIDGDDSGVESTTATEGNTIKQNSIQILHSGVNRKHIPSSMRNVSNEHE